jgi:23S rRNA (adenine2503-C2)-methyltransferase
MTENVHDSRAVEQFFREHRLDPHRLKRLRYLLYSERRPIQDVLREIPQAARQAFADRFRFDWFQLVERSDSRVDSSRKLVLRTPDGLLLETVIMQSAGGSTSLCVSSQIGCAMRCTFCATGAMGLARDLTAGEIVAQVAQVNQWLRPEQRHVRNVVFMGMGEPLHNEQAVHAALEQLQSAAYFCLSPRRLLVSTVGVAEAMVRFARRFPLVGLALSLHTTNQQLREQLIPLARRYPLDDLRVALREANRWQRRPLMIEYLMLEGINDSDEDALRLGEFVDGLWVHFNLIPYNPIANGPPEFRATPRERRDAFANLLRQRGHLTTIRYSQGRDIAAACGQLAQPIQATL